MLKLRAEFRNSLLGLLFPSCLDAGQPRGFGRLARLFRFAQFGRSILTGLAGKFCGRARRSEIGAPRGQISLGLGKLLP